MRIKKAKYIFIFLTLSLFAGAVLGNGSSATGISSRSDALSESDSVVGDSVGYVPADMPLVVNPEGGAISGEILPDTIPASDSVPVRERKPFLDDIISGKNKDSLVYDLRTKMVYIYEQGDVDYQDKNIKGDFMRVKLDEKLIFVHGREDTVAGRPTRSQFTREGESVQFDTMTFNMVTGKASIRGISTQQGDGFLTGARVKKLSNNTLNIAQGRYTTCDADHPHFFVAMSRAKAIPGKKVIIGPSYLVMEDVPLYFLGLPFGFFPINESRTSGFIMPEYGEEIVKGFFIRNGGYYFTFKDYADLALTAGIYTYGSWDASVASRYIKRYKYNGGINLNFTKNILGERGLADYVNRNEFQVRWNHTQDPRARPSSTFSANVDYKTSGYSKYGAQTVSDYLTTQTNSSIAYSKTWAGTPFSMSTNMSLSQNAQTNSVAFGFPTLSFNMSRISPFKGKTSTGQRWYEKISLSYALRLENRVTAKEEDLFKERMFKDMKTGVQHTIPISASFNLLKYINLTPSVNYQERWYTKKIMQVWDEEKKQVVTGDTIYGFNRLYDYTFSIGGSTKIYGTYRPSKKSVPVVRHVMTPTASFNFTPDFSDSRYGYYQYVQSDTLGTLRRYSPFANELFGVPSASQSAGMSFGLQQTLEMKVASKTDTSGFKKIKLIDNLSINSSYDFLADSLNLRPFNISFRTSLLKNIGINVSATLDPYDVDVRGNRINRFMLRNGRLGRITNASTSFGYSFQSSQSGRPAMNDINSGVSQLSARQQADFFSQPGSEKLDINEQRRILASTYYDFNIPWNFGFNYSLSYTNNGIRSNVLQTVNFTASITLTEKMGVTLSELGYDFQKSRLTPGAVTMTRDLHCWQMSFTWVPVGFRKSWSFNIGVRSSMLKDLKYDRHSSFFDSLYD